MKRAAFTGRVWLLVLLLVPAARAEDLRVSRSPGMLRVEGAVPGPVLDLTAHRDRAGTDALWLLVLPAGARARLDKPCDGSPVQAPLELWRLTPPGAGDAGARLERLRDDLAPGTQRLWSLDLDGSGARVLLAGSPGTLTLLPTDGAPPRPVLEDPLFRPRSAQVAQGPAPARAVLVAAGLGRTKLLRSGGPDGTWDTLLSMDVDKSVQPGRHGLHLSSVPPVFVGRSGGGSGGEADGALHFATPQVAVSDRRLRGQRIVLDGAGARREEWWAGLPEAERVLESNVLMLADEPALFVTTHPADKLGLFGEKRLRLFRMREDRSRMGHPPFFAVQTRANLWQAIAPYVRDVDGDAIEDLVLAYWKGLKDDRIVLDLYRGTAGGGLRRSARTTAFDVKDGDRSFIDFGGDIDGDGTADLLLRSAGRLLVYSGTAPGDRAMVASKPSFEIPLAQAVADDDGGGSVTIGVGVGSGGVHVGEAVGAPPRPRLIDLNGDGRHAVLDLAPLDDGTLRLTLVLFD